MQVAYPAPPCTTLHHPAPPCTSLHHPVLPCPPRPSRPAPGRSAGGRGPGPQPPGRRRQARHPGAHRRQDPHVPRRGEGQTGDQPIHNSSSLLTPQLPFPKLTSPSLNSPLPTSLNLNQHQDIIETLLCYGASVSIPNFSGVTPLSLCSENR